VVFSGEDFGYWKNWTCNYLLSQGHAIWEIIQEAYVIAATLDNMIQGEVQSYGNKYKALNLNVGEEGSEQMIVTLQSLPHGSVGYQHARTRVDLTKKAYPYKCNQEHKQEKERMQLNL
jgi:hypothetical protein